MEHLDSGDTSYKEIDYESVFGNFQQGDIVKGYVIKVAPDEVLVDVGGKFEGVIPIRELSSTSVSDPKEFVQVGDELELYILREENEDGQFTLSKKRVDQARGWLQAVKDYEEDKIIMAPVKDVVKGGVIVDTYNLRGFVPASQLRIKGPHEELIGQELPLKLIEVDQRRNKLVLSHRDALRAEKGQQRAEVYEFLEVGHVVPGKVTRVADFGAFVDIGGAEALLPISEVSWRRAKHPSEYVNVGDELFLTVMKIDRENFKISLSLKQMQPDPWTQLGDRYQEGQVVEGHVTKLANFGAFVEIEPGVEALLPAVEMAEELFDPREAVRIGQHIRAVITRLSMEERRMPLSLRGAPELGLTTISTEGLSVRSLASPEGDEADPDASDDDFATTEGKPDAWGLSGLVPSVDAPSGPVSEVVLATIESIAPDGGLIVRLTDGDLVELPGSLRSAGVPWKVGIGLLVRTEVCDEATGLKHHSHVFKV
jgi:ribosomal protein S1